MSRSSGPHLPPEILAVADGSELASRVGVTFTFITEDVDGWPSIALLSVGEVLAVDPGTLRLAAWPGSTTTASIERTGRATMLYVDQEVWYVRLHARRGPDLSADGLQRAYFECTVEDVLLDTVTYATMTGGIRFELSDPPATLDRWQRAIDLLRAAPAVIASSPDSGRAAG
jgi:hypothetical protein